MAFIDWSDSEGMFDLLLEFIRDEMNEGDDERRGFLRRLFTNVSSLNACTVEDAIRKLTLIQESVDEQFRSDPVMVHLGDFIQELERIK